MVDHINISRFILCSIFYPMRSASVVSPIYRSTLERSSVVQEGDVHDSCIERKLKISVVQKVSGTN